MIDIGISSLQRPFLGAGIKAPPEPIQPSLTNRPDVLPARGQSEVFSRAGELLKQRQDEFAAVIARNGEKSVLEARLEAQQTIRNLEIAAVSIGRPTGSGAALGQVNASPGPILLSAQEVIEAPGALDEIDFPYQLILDQIAAEADETSSSASNAASIYSPTSPVQSLHLYGALTGQNMKGFFYDRAF